MIEKENCRRQLWQGFLADHDEGNPKPMISDAALGLFFALAGMIASSQTFAYEGAVSGGDVSTLSAGDSGDQQS